MLSPLLVPFLSPNSDTPVVDHTYVDEPPEWDSGSSSEDDVNDGEE